MYTLIGGFQYLNNNLFYVLKPNQYKRLIFEDYFEYLPLKTMSKLNNLFIMKLIIGVRYLMRAVSRMYTVATYFKPRP